MAKMAKGARSGAVDVCIHAQAVAVAYNFIVITVLLFLLRLACVIVLTCACLRHWANSALAAVIEEVSKHEKSLQSHTTYSWKSATPRFKPLPENVQG